MKKLFKPNDFSFIAFGRISVAAIQGIFYLLLASILNPESYGQISYIIAIAGTASIVSLFGLQNSLIIYKSKNDSELANQIMLLLLLTTSVSFLILLIFDWKIALLSSAMSFFAINLHSFLANKNYKNFMIYSLIKSSFILILPFVFYFALDLFGIILGMILANLVCGLTFFRDIKFKSNSFIQLKKKYKIILHNFGVDSSTKLMRYVDKIIILPILGYVYLGIFQFNTQILFAIEIIPLSLYSFLLTKNATKSTDRISYFVIIFSTALSIMGILIAPYFVSTLFPDYVEGVPSLQILLLTTIPFTLSLIFTAKLQSRESTTVGYSGIIQIGSLIILIILLGSVYDLLGLAYSFVISSIFNTFFLLFLLLKQKT